MSTFNLKALASGKVLVTGTDETGAGQSTILDGRRWANVKRKLELKKAGEEFDATVAKIHAPLVEAERKLAAAQAAPEPDPLTVVEIKPAVEGTLGSSVERVILDEDGAILRAIEEGNTERLMWFGGSILILAEATTEQLDLGV